MPRLENHNTRRYAVVVVSLGMVLGALLFSAWERGWSMVLRRSAGMLRAALPTLAAGASGIPLFAFFGLGCMLIGTPGHVGQVTFFSASCSAAVGLVVGIVARRRERARILVALPAGRVAVEPMMLRNSALLAIAVSVIGAVAVVGACLGVK